MKPTRTMSPSGTLPASSKAPMPDPDDVVEDGLLRTMQRLVAEARERGEVIPEPSRRELPTQPLAVPGEQAREWPTPGYLRWKSRAAEARMRQERRG